MQNYLPASFCSLTTDHCSLKHPRGQSPRGCFTSAAAAAAVIIVRAATAAVAVVVAGEGENDEDGDDYPDKALVVVKKSAKAVVIHGRPPKSFLRIFPPR